MPLVVWLLNLPEKNKTPPTIITNASPINMYCHPAIGLGISSPQLRTK
jgi:hypothetical protein